MIERKPKSFSASAKWATKKHHKGPQQKKQGDKKQGNKKKKSPYRKEAAQLVKHELKPQMQEIRRYLDYLRSQKQQGVADATTLGQRTQADLTDIFGAANSFNSGRADHTAQVMSQAQQALGASYDSAAGNINNAYAKASESANETLQRLGITPVGAQMQEDQAWLTGLNEQNRTAAAQGLAAQQGIYAQSSGMLGQAISGEQATLQGRAAVGTQNQISDVRNQANLQINDLMSQRKDLKGQKGAMINDAMKLLKQTAFEQMMEQAQLAAVNRKAAEQFKLEYAKLNETSSYHQGLLQAKANDQALEKWKEQNDFWLKNKGLNLSNKTSPKAARKEFMNSDISGWKDATRYTSYMTKAYGWSPSDVQKLNPILSSIQSNWGSHGQVWGPITTSFGWNQNYQKTVEHLKSQGLWGLPGMDQFIKDYLNIGASKF